MPGIHIRNTYKPINCHACDFIYALPNCPCHSMPKEQFYAHKELKNRTHPACPITHLSNHGRLVDGDKLAEGCKEPDYCRRITEIVTAPTIIPEDRGWSKC